MADGFWATEIHTRHEGTAEIPTPSRQWISPGKFKAWVVSVSSDEPCEIDAHDLHDCTGYNGAMCEWLMCNECFGSAVNPEAYMKQDAERRDERRLLNAIRMARESIESSEKEK